MIYRTIAPPRMILGVSLLFWGGMTGRPLIGLLLAVLVEAAHWTRLRWEVTETTFHKAWQLTALAAAGVTVLLWLEGNPLTTVPTLFSWLPALLLPMQWVQTFGSEGSMSLHTFSFFAKQRAERNKKFGISEDAVHLHFGNVYFVLVIASAAMGEHAAGGWFLAGLIVLVGWAFLARGTRPFAIVMFLGMALLLGWGGQVAMERAYQWASHGGRGGMDEEQFDPNHTSTAIGRRGRVVQSQNLLWRIRPEQGQVPGLLRTATYNAYRDTSWNKRLPQSELTTITDFNDLETLIDEDGRVFYLMDPTAGEEAIDRSLPRFRLRGSVKAQHPLPLPGNAVSLQGFMLDGIERNPLATIRTYPSDPVSDGSILWQPGSSAESAPWGRIDRVIPNREREVIREIAAHIGLKNEASVEAKLKLLKAWFFQEFTYSLNLEISRAGAWQQQRSGKVFRSELEQFLTTTKQGHCEYFATAAVLLLREAGIATRYAVGYAVNDFDPQRNEFLIRGVHGHAWCRVWDEEASQWLDFDPTPADWHAINSREVGFAQAFQDWLLRAKEDFYLWRNDRGNTRRIVMGAGLMALGFGSFIAYRLRHSRKTVVSKADHRQARRHPLRRLERKASRLLGERPIGVPLAEWLRPLGSVLAEPGALDELLQVYLRQRFDVAKPGDELDRRTLERRVLEQLPRRWRRKAKAARRS